MHMPVFMAEAVGQIAYFLYEITPHLPLHLHVLSSALVTIYIGAHGSLSRPATAAKRPSDPHDKTKNDDEDPPETAEINLTDALILPITASLTLAGMYFVIQYVGPQILNRIAAVLFFCTITPGLIELLRDAIALAITVVLPDKYLDRGILWTVQPHDKQVTGAEHVISRTSPLPGPLGSLSIPARLNSYLWTLRRFLYQRYRVVIDARNILHLDATGPAYEIPVIVIAALLMLYVTVVDCPWYMTNIQGLACTYLFLQLVSPNSFATVSLLLSALFVYDVYFVFYTPMMVTVATNLDVPVKMLFPRPHTATDESKPRPMAMLGLGDIVVPGMVCALALRFDLWLHYLRKSRSDTQKPFYANVTRQWGNSLWTGNALSYLFGSRRDCTHVPVFAKTYFLSTMLGYCVGMMTTLFVMVTWDHAQPALLYLVPCILCSLWLTALVRGEICLMWDYTPTSDGSVKEQASTDSDRTGGNAKTEVDGSTSKTECLRDDARGTGWLHVSCEPIGTQRQNDEVGAEDDGATQPSWKNLSASSSALDMSERAGKRLRTH